MMEQRFVNWREGFFLLNKLSNIIDKNSIGLSRDNGLVVFDKLSWPQTEQRKKKIIKIFKDCGLSITLATNITSVDFLDLTLNFKTESEPTVQKTKQRPDIYRY